MSGPWENYKNKGAQEDGPWSKFSVQSDSGPPQSYDIPLPPEQSPVEKINDQVKSSLGKEDSDNMVYIDKDGNQYKHGRPYKEETVEIWGNKYPKELVDNISAGIGAGMPVGNIPGVSKLANFIKGKGDRAMQMAAGMKNYIPGVGQELIDRGIWGTREGLKEGTKKAMSELSEKVGQNIDSLKGPINSGDIADKMMETARGKFTSQGIPASGHAGDIDKSIEMAAEVAGRGELSPKAAWELSQKAGNQAYQANKEIPGLTRNKTIAPIYQTEERAYKQAVKDLAEKEGLPDLAKDVSSQSKLISALKALGDNEKNSTKLSDFLFSGGAGLGGLMSGGDNSSSLKNAGIAAAAMSAARSPLGRSTLAHALSRGVAPAVSGAGQVLPLVLQRNLAKEK